jgi:hypothetical protein
MDGRLQAPYASFKLPRRGHFFAARSAKKRRLFWFRVLRFLNSVSAAVLVAGGAIIGGLVVALATAVSTLAAPNLPAWVIGALIGGLLLLILQAIAEYKKRQYDPTLIFTFDERFNSAHIRKARSTACQVLKQNRGGMRQQSREYRDIDDVLDFLEDLGFYLHGQQISPEVVHHHFYHWIRGYYTTAQDYIQTVQNNEPTQWEYIKRLYDLTSSVERRKTKMKREHAPTEEELQSFFDDEIALVSSDDPSSPE